MIDGDLFGGFAKMCLGVALVGITYSCKNMDIIRDDAVGQATYLAGMIGGTLTAVKGLSKAINLSGVAA